MAQLFNVTHRVVERYTFLELEEEQPVQSLPRRAQSVGGRPRSAVTASTSSGDECMTPDPHSCDDHNSSPSSDAKRRLGQEERRKAQRVRTVLSSPRAVLSDKLSFDGFGEAPRDDVVRPKKVCTDVSTAPQTPPTILLGRVNSSNYVKGKRDPNALSTSRGRSHEVASLKCLPETHHIEVKWTFIHYEDIAEQPRRSRSADPIMSEVLLENRAMVSVNVHRTSSALSEPIGEERPRSYVLVENPRDSQEYLMHQWIVDAKKLRCNDRSLVSRPFKLALSSGSFDMQFKLMIFARKLADSKGGQSFQMAQGKGNIQVKCEHALEDVVCCSLGFRLSVAQSATAPPLCQKICFHDFTQSAAYSSQDWDFGAAVNNAAQTFIVTMQLLPESCHLQYHGSKPHC